MKYVKINFNIKQKSESENVIRRFLNKLNPNYQTNMCIYFCSANLLNVRFGFYIVIALHIYTFERHFMIDMKDCFM